jgi:pimeloyl-ACP methyl ester carboxylesterase
MRHLLSPEKRLDVRGTTVFSNRVRSLSPKPRKWRRRLVLLHLTLATVLLLTTIYQTLASKQDFETFLAPGKLIDIGGYRLHLYCTGQRVQGSPTVVFEGGLGATSIMWSMAQMGVAVRTRACSYDRAGYGWSDPGPQPRTARQIVQELHDLLEKAGEQPPYSLVGHSFGGIIIRLYASSFPAEVAGLVLVDARHEDFFRRMPPAFLQVDETNLQRARMLRLITPLGLTRLAGKIGLLESFERYLTPLPDKQLAAARAIMIYKPQHWQTSIAEREAIEESFNEVRHTHLPSELRLVVLIAAMGVEAWQLPGSPLDQATRDMWMELQADLAKLTKRSRIVIVNKSGHYIHLDQPDAVIEAILSELPGS